VLEVADGLDADLVVLTAHGTLSDAHASITRLILESGRRPVLVLHEPSVEKRTPRFAAATSEPQVVVAPTDLTPESSAAVDLSIDLARKLPIELHLLHLLPHGGYRRNEADDEEARRRLRALVPEDLANRALLHVEHGDAGQAIARVADQLSASCIVMGEHTRRPLRRWFSRDVSRDVLHRAHCPVWYVPARRAA
jgi:nucleotide-binding universal stress UspA family protein